MFNTYFQDIFKTAKAGDATEPSFYSALKNFLEALAAKKNRKISVTPLPKKTEAGNPDFRVWDGRYKIIGYIEAKAPEIENLTEVEGSEQLKRYRKTFPNLILTNFFEFRLYRNGKQVSKVKVGNPFILKMGTAPPFENEQAFETFFEQFLSFSLPRTFSARSLAIELAKRTRFLRDEVIAEELKEEEQKQSGHLLGFYKAFKDHLIASLTPKDFADLYAQTITYGLFAARSRAENGFNRKLAYDYIPHTIGILRDVFKFVSLGELPTSMEWIVDDIAEVLAVADVRKVIHDFYEERKGRDPIIHFYETFLAEYDPEERERRGVYYTPEPVVGYIVRSVHKLLKERFNKEDGFATQSVTVLDPAAGTLTFPVEATRQAVEEFQKKFGEGGAKSLIRDHVLKNFYAFELMMASYAVGHLKVGFVLDEYGYKLSEDERFNLYLTNTLDFSKEDPNKLPGILEQTIAKESGEALRVKEDVPILVILGNPPYSSSRSEGTKFINNLMQDYLKGLEVEKERKKGAIQDEYVRFIRFAHWKIEQAGRGILAYITNNSYLDGLVHRSMRKKLLDSFDEVYVLNLHGNSRIKETTPKGEKDENVFDIQQGVVITLLLSTGKKRDNRTINYQDVWGLREAKYRYLETNDVESTQWRSLDIDDNFYFFTIKDKEIWEQYNLFFPIQTIFDRNSTGVLTRRDDLVIADSPQELRRKIATFADTANFTDDMITQIFGVKSTSEWNLGEARKHVTKEGFRESEIKLILYRPFDLKYIYYNDKLVSRPLRKVMENLLVPGNLGFAVKRQVKISPFSHAFVTDTLCESCLLESAYANAQIFPLYIHELRDSNQGALLPDSESMKHNLRPSFLANLKYPHAPAEVFHYIYALLYSDVYRKKYEEFLKIDFPRVPFTNDYKLFQKLAQLGKQLVDLHLLKSPELNNPIAKFYGKGDSVVRVRKYDEKAGMIYTNETQYFACPPKPEGQRREGIEPEVWNYYIGGYQVLDKWLKDRKGRTLSSEDIKHYCKVVTTLKKTIEIQEKIDELYPEVEKNLVRIQ